MPSLNVARATNTAFTTAGYRPTAVFVGGTAGIGEGTVRAFARATKGNAHIVICGRNQANAEQIIATLPKHPDSKYEFVQCDATLMKSVVKASQEIKSRVGDAPINYVVASQGIMSFDGFAPTEEGIDRKLALHFYSRWKFVDELMPKLEKAKQEGQEARVMSILAPGTGAVLDVDDLGLKKNFTLFRAARQAPTYNDIFVDEYSRRHPSMAFIHAIPGFVDTSLGRNMPWYLKALYPLLRPLSTSPEDCGEWMASALTSPEHKQGAFYISEKADPISLSKIHSDEKARQALVEHYTKEVAFGN